MTNGKNILDLVKEIEASKSSNNQSGVSNPSPIPDINVRAVNEGTNPIGTRLHNYELDEE